MRTLDISHLRTLILTLAAGLWLSACATGGGSGGLGAQSERRAEALRDHGQYAEAASVYIGLASGAQGRERERLTVLAVEQWLDAGDGRRAQNAMADVADLPDGDLRALWNLNRAALELWDGRPDNALNILEPMSAQPLSPIRRARVQALRGDAWFQKEDPQRAIALYAELERWLSDPALIERNRQRLWAGLKVANPQVLQEKAALSRDPIARGWLALGALAAATGQQGIGWRNGVARWRETNSSHPGLSVLGDLDAIASGPLEYPRQVALLLPLSGPNAAAGRAVQNGFFGAYFRASVGLDDAQQIRIFDVVSEGGATAAYQAALNQGAEIVIGPLVRREVAEIAALGALPVPMLALNYAPAQQATPPGMFQFALAPEDEAAAAARRAVQDGRRRALAMVPNNDWGRRLLKSFADELAAQGGQLLEYDFYEQTDQDFSFDIQKLMGLSLSRQRHERLRANLGGTIEFDPRRRADAQFIFLAARAPVGRLIKSQLKFHFSGDVPVYATSTIFAMDGRSDSDLNGVMFADTPWIIGPQSWLAELPDLYAEYWPKERRLGRLHAMGYDAYLLINELFRPNRERALSVNGATGRLFMGPDGRIHRDLPWAEFQGGQPVSLPPADGYDEESGPSIWPTDNPAPQTGASISAPAVP